MIIIWRGLGLPILLAGFCVTTVALLPFDLVYVMNHSWPRLMTSACGGALVFWLGWLRETRYGRRDSVYGSR